MHYCATVSASNFQVLSCSGWRYSTSWSFTRFLAGPARIHFWWRWKPFGVFMSSLLADTKNWKQHGEAFNAIMNVVFPPNQLVRWLYVLSQASPASLFGYLSQNVTGYGRFCIFSDHCIDNISRTKKTRAGGQGAGFPFVGWLVRRRTLCPNITHRKKRIERGIAKQMLCQHLT